HSVRLAIGCAGPPECPAAHDRDLDSGYAGAIRFWQQHHGIVCDGLRCLLVLRDTAFGERFHDCGFLWDQERRHELWIAVYRMGCGRNYWSENRRPVVRPL